MPNAPTNHNAKGVAAPLFRSAVACYRFHRSLKLASGGTRYCYQTDNYTH
ncbi:hypothetical protein [Rubritalea tangerina]